MYELTPTTTVAFSFVFLYFGGFILLGFHTKHTKIRLLFSNSGLGILCAFLSLEAKTFNFVEP